MANDFNGPIMKDLQGYLTTEQIKAIYNKCRNWRERVLIRLLWKSGRRISEILKIRVCDIDFENGQIIWNILKKKVDMKKRKSIDTFTLDILRFYINKARVKDQDYLLHNGNRNQHITRQRAFQLIRRICKDAGINYVGEKRPHPHHFRHSFAVNLAKKLKSPGDVRKLQMTLEHSKLEMTEQYLQFGDDDIRELLEED